VTSQELLKATSRAFYLSLTILPPGARQTMSLGYLLARCADSLSDGPWLSQEERLPALQLLQSSLRDPSQLQNWQTLPLPPGDQAEARLLRHWPKALEELELLPQADQHLVRDIVDTLIEGMRVDLLRFPGRVQSEEELRRHLWAAAGCVGHFWSAVCRLHEPRLAGLSPRFEELGTRLGNALQITNVLRDVSSDRAEGRDYLPPDQPELRYWLAYARQEFAASQEYLFLIPWNCARLRLAALWPWALGLATLSRVARSGPRPSVRVKVPRWQVYRMLLATPLLVCFNPLLRLYCRSCLEQLP
jgi:farnesyl-diphosphate farnesyltransferase